VELLYQKSIDLEHVADLCEIGIQREQPEPRNHSAWHVTNLLEASRLITKGKPCYPGGVEAPSGIMSLGRIWETVMDCCLDDYARKLGGGFIPNVIYVKDDISGSLDGVLVMPMEWFSSLLVVECKLRFTLNIDIPLNHLRQIRAYCHLADTDTVCYVSGHISTTPPMVQALLRIIRFTQLSIEETWEGIVNTKKYLESLGLGPANPAK